MSLSSSPAKESCPQMSDEICLDCSKYDFEGALAAIKSGKYSDRIKYPSDDIVIAKVGNRYRTPFETNCSLCRILLASRKSALELYPISDKDKFNSDELRELLLSQGSALNSCLADKQNLYNAYELQTLQASQASVIQSWLIKLQNNNEPDDLKPRALLASRKLNIEMCLLLFKDKKGAEELCALLASQKSALESFSDQSEDDTDELRAFILLKDTTVHDVSVRGSFFAWRNRSIYIDLDSSCFPLNSEPRRVHGAKHGYAVIRQPHEQPKFTAQVVPPYFDPTVAIEWISHCREHHRKTCSSQKDASAINLRLIDCETLDVEQGHSESSYVALSYVWGSSAARDRYSLEPASGSIFALPSVLPAVILDAIAVTKSLGFRYLWVDKFCIDQTNNDVKHQQITQMDSVYENAELTIVAAAGVDETHGLPGVSSKPRSTQPMARIGDLTILSTMRDIQDSIRSSKWSTRGWTFQEALLTRRRLVFTEEQVYFECAAMNCSESFSASTDALYNEWGSTSPQYQRPGIFERSGWQKFVGFRGKPGNTLNIFIRYLTAVKDYTARELRFEHDSLNAFAGIMKKFERAREPIIQLWGIPTTIKRRELTERCFAEALCWSHAHTCWDKVSRPIRRPDFPSWSWAGWAGEVKYGKKQDPSFMVSQLPSIQFSEWQQSIMNATVHADISLESEAGQILELSNIAESISFGRFDAGFARILRLEANVFPSSWFSYDGEIWKLLMSPAIMSLSHGSESEDGFFEQLKKEDSGLQCVHVKSAGTTIFGLIVETRGRVSSRVGLMIADWGYKEPDYSFLERRTFRIV